jgi:4-amino-4-deoxy-L-arabinose transferase-like glycosyltransferase
VRVHHVVVAVLLGLFVVCGVVSLRGDSVTFDETAHLGAGVSYLETGDFRLNPEHPPLAKLIAAAPLKALGRGGGDYGSAAWTSAVADEWVFGFELINGPIGAAARRDPASRLVPARLAMLGLGLLLCVAVYAWARELYGPAGSLVALALTVSCPTILAHARLVTTDLPGALGSLATIWAFWRWSRRPDWLRASIASVALAAALLFKFSTLLLIPVVLVLAGASLATGRIRRNHAAGAAVLMAAVSFVAVWGAYGFRFAASPVPGRTLDWASLSSAPAAPIVFARDRHLLPEAYLYGIAYAKAEASGRTGFLDGEESNAGWYRYFPEAFLFKTPLPFLALVLWVVGAQTWRSRARSFDGWCIALVPLTVATLAVASRFNIGHRHLAPVYPFLCLAAAPAGDWIARRGRRAIAVGALLLGCGVSFALATPGYLSYFNALGGGARDGWRHFVDSNIDWGQDLARLRRWMDANGAAEVDLAYFGTADPKAYGIAFNKVALFLDFSPDMPVTRPEPGRLLAASVTMLQGVYLDSDRALATELLRRRQLARGDIDTYLADRRARDARGDVVEHLGPWIVKRGLLTADQVRDAAEMLPGTWLARARDEWTPIARAGDSILIYRAK